MTKNVGVAGYGEAFGHASSEKYPSQDASVIFYSSLPQMHLFPDAAVSSDAPCHLVLAYSTSLYHPV